MHSEFYDDSRLLRRFNEPYRLERFKNLSPEDAERLVALSVELFKKDFEYMRTCLVAEVERTKKTKSASIYQDTLNPSLFKLPFHGFALENPVTPYGLPILIIRPNEPAFYQSKLGIDDHHNIFHTELFENWELVSKDQSYPERNAFYTLLTKPRNADLFHNVYFELTLNTETNVYTLAFRGISMMFDTTHEPQNILKFVHSLKAYGVSQVAPTPAKDKILLEEIILEEQLLPLIEENAKFLELYCKKKYVKEYVRLARKIKLKSQLRRTLFENALRRFNTHDLQKRTTDRDVLLDEYIDISEYEQLRFEKYEEFIQKIKELRPGEVIDPATLAQFSDTL